MENRLKQENAHSFIKGGKAKFVLHTLKSDKQFRYFVKKKEREGNQPVWWVYWEHGDSQEYFGLITSSDALFFRSLHSDHNEEFRMAYELFEYFWRKLLKLEVPDRLVILHLGKCGICARPLKDAKSLEIGIGPECRKRLGI